jgi:hypothetical protein
VGKVDPDRRRVRVPISEEKGPGERLRAKGLEPVKIVVEGDR